MRNHVLTTALEFALIPVAGYERSAIESGCGELAVRGKGVALDYHNALPGEDERHFDEALHCSCGSPERSHEPAAELLDGAQDRQQRRRRAPLLFLGAIAAAVVYMTMTHDGDEAVQIA